MGRLVEGRWHGSEAIAKIKKGHFIRNEAAFRDAISADGSTDFAAEAGRYHLYVSYACPWAHRTLIFRKLKKLESVISVSVVNPLMGDDGWTFAPYEGATDDAVNGASFLREVYTKAKADHTGRVTVPVLWDKQRETIVCNESAEIIRMFNSAFDALTSVEDDYYPEPLRDEIDAVNKRVYDTVNNGVYRCGFATTQQAYEESYDALFETLDWLEQRLGAQRYLVGDQITEADWRLFTTAVRFDPVYHGHFKCNRRRLVEYPNLWGHMLELYQVPGVAETVNLDHIKTHYYWSHTSINPKRIVAKGPELDLSAPHGRDKEY